jgi:hypothetical protein
MINAELYSALSFPNLVPEIVASCSAAGNTKTRKSPQIGQDLTLATGGKHIHTAFCETIRWVKPRKIPQRLSQTSRFHAADGTRSAVKSS